jgi:inosine-uridine nucleoside N-ribohydrolase
MGGTLTIVIQACYDHAQIMPRKILVSSLLLCTCFAVARAAEPVRLILDTDIGNDVDDALALAMIHALETRGDVKLLAVTITKDNRYTAPFVDLVNTFYGRPDIPIGVVHNGKTPDDSDMLKVPAEEHDANGKVLYPHSLQDGAQAPDALQLLTKVLSSQPDRSVTIAQIGFSTNLARLLESPGGRDLVKRKVKVLCLMAGNFAKPQPEYNVYTDPPSAGALFENWPTPMIFSGFEIGLQITFPFEAIQKDFSYVPHHPIPDAYRLYVKKPEDHPNWDSTAVLEAIEPDRGYFALSAPGRVTLGPKNTTVFTPDPQGNARYLIIKQDQVSRVRQLIADLVTEPPAATAPAASAQRIAF